MRIPVVAGNWKMNGTRASVQALLEALKAGISADCPAEILVCAPFPFLDQVTRLVAGTRIGVGAQTLSMFASGAYTGEVSAEMLVDVGCQSVIVGHSERRALFHETDEQVAARFVRAQSAGLVPVLCVGETLVERQAGMTLEVVRRQLMAVVDCAGIAGFERALLAYEPVWAIGTGQTATPEQAQEVHAALRGLLASRDAAVAQQLRILYGGSVKASNAASLFGCPDIDGGLVGGASLDAHEFLAICQAAESLRKTQ